MTAQPPASTLGFTGDPDALLTTQEVAARLGYRSMATWYNNKPGRDASRFPSPIRRGLYRLGDLQDWARRASKAPSPNEARAMTRSPATDGPVDADPAGPSPSLPQNRGARPEIRNVVQLRLAKLKGTG